MTTYAPPPGLALDWAADCLNVTAVHWSRRLPGGTHALTDVVRGPDGQQMVLRRFPDEDTAVHRESRVLQALDGLDGLAPVFLAADPDGARAGVPTILTTLLPGTASITPRDPHDFAGQLGRVLARLHQHRTSPGLPDVLPAPPPQQHLFPDAPIDEQHRIWDRLRSAPRVLTHYDFWSGNTVWHNGQLTGVVDWSGAGLAPRGFDVSWARLDLVLLYDPTIAEVFTSAYCDAANHVVPDLHFWDVYVVANADPNIESWAPNYQSLGRTDLSATVLRRRLDTWGATLRQGSMTPP